MSSMWNDNPRYEGLVLGWDGEQWAYATPERWRVRVEHVRAGVYDDGKDIILAKCILGDLPGLDDITRPPRCDNTFSGRVVGEEPQNE